MAMPGRKYSTGSGYKYSINGQEKEIELNENITTAEFWEYDSRIGRRWNLDPKPNVSLSLYSCFAGNPVSYNDAFGDTTKIFNAITGAYIRTIYDNLPNQSHFVTGAYLPANWRRYNTNDKKAEFVRKNSIAFIGENTVADSKLLEAEANKTHEVFFKGNIDPKTREIRLTELKLPDEAYDGNAEITIGNYIDKVIIGDKEQKATFLIGHTHQKSISDGSLTDPKMPTPPGKSLWFNKDNGSGDYGPLLNRTYTKYGNIPGTYDQGTYTITTKGQTPALIITHNGITIYGTGTKYNVPVYAGDYGSVDNIVKPVEQSYIPFKSIKK